MELISLIVAPLIVSVIVLVIEYWTGWFAEKTGTPTLRSQILRLKPKTDRYYRKVKDAAIDVSKFLWYTILTFTSLYLLTSEASQNPTYRFELYSLLVIACIIATRLYNKPMNTINSVLPLVILLVAYFTIGPGDDSGRFIWFGDTSFRSFDEATRSTNSGVYLATLLSLGGVWIAFHFLNSYYAKAITIKTDELERKLGLLYESADIKQSLKESNQSRYRDFLGHWRSFIGYARGNSEENSDILGHCVPTHFDGFDLHIGCRTLTDQRNLAIERVIGQKTYPPRSIEIAIALQQFLGSPYYRITADLIDSEHFDKIKEDMQQLDKERSH